MLTTNLPKDTHSSTIQLRCIGSLRPPPTKPHPHGYVNFTGSWIETASASLPHSITAIISGQRILLPLYSQCYCSHWLALIEKAATVSVHARALGSVHLLYLTLPFCRKLWCCYPVALTFSLRLSTVRKKSYFFRNYIVNWPSSLTHVTPLPIGTHLPPPVLVYCTSLFAL